jgi:hypothetical protein
MGQSDGSDQGVPQQIPKGGGTVITTVGELKSQLARYRDDQYVQVLAKDQYFDNTFCQVIIQAVLDIPGWHTDGKDKNIVRLVVDVKGSEISEKTLAEMGAA